ncbi:MAG: DUF2834 domain-containing protein [Pseudomonadota bacterium]
MPFTGLELFYMAIGLLSVALIYVCNAHLYRSDGVRVGSTGLEAFYYVIALAALLIGWYFNFAYFREYAAEIGWWHWTTLLFVNPASASGGQDLIIANLILFPMWTIIEGRRSGLRHSWMYFVMSLLTSYAFGIALFLAMHDRQLRWNKANSGAIS